MPKNKVYLHTKDFLVSNEEFTLDYDPNLDMLITKPQPKNLAPYYEESTYISHQDESQNLIDKIYQSVKKYTLNKKVKLINKHELETKSLLDIGCGTGEFLLNAKNKNWKTYGVEPGIAARKKGENKGLNIVEKIEDLQNTKFNIITLWHVLEHLPNLETHIKKLEELLQIGGTIIIAVPNFKSYDAIHYKEFWAAYDTPRHLWHFSQTAISNLFSKKGFKILNTTPMYFDSFYVALLSEKYKNGKSNYLKAFYHGFISNYKARNTGEYSSLIYTLKRA